MRFFIAIAIGLLVTLGGGYALVSYAGTADFSSYVSKDELAAGEKLADLIRTRQFPAFLAAVDPSIRQVDLAVLNQMADTFPKGQPFTIRVTGWTRNWSKSLNGGPAQDFTVMQLLYLFPNGSAMRATFTINEAGSAPSFVGVNFMPVTAGQIHQSEFRIQDMPGGQQSIFLIAILLDVFAIASFVLCLMGPRPSWRTRWLWALLTLIGVVRINILWATGETFLSPLSFMLPPATLNQAPLGTSWVLSLTMPLGAIVYWSVRRARRWDVPLQPEALFAEDRPAAGV